MSYDPYASGSDVPPEDGYRSAYSGDISSANQRVRPAAIALIVVGVLNVLASCWFLFNLAVTAMTPANELMERQKAVLEILYSSSKAPMDAGSAQAIKNQSLILSVIINCLSLLGTILTLIAGFRMMALKNYALCVCGAICAAIPFISGSACCCVGEVIGIWALIVLLNEQVRASFR